MAGINHEPELPVEEGEAIGITGGSFIIRLPLRTIRGAVDDGVLTSNGDDTFQVDMDLLLAGGASAVSSGTLRHDVFPPTIEATIE